MKKQPGRALCGAQHTVHEWHRARAPRVSGADRPGACCIAAPAV